MITERGYLVDKLDRKLCSVHPKITFGNGWGVKPLRLWLEPLKTGDPYAIPRFLGIKEYGLPDTITEQYGKPWEWDGQLSIDLKPVQIPVMEKAICSYENNTGGILNLPCGFGKTVMALYLAAKYKVRTLIVVHTTDLLNQWMERIRVFLPGIRIGVIQSKRFEIEDITIGMLQTLVKPRIGCKELETFGHLIIDETHHIPAQTFINVMWKIQPRYRLGLSATVNRVDGCFCAVEYFMGEIIENVESIRKTNPIKVKPIITQIKVPPFGRKDITDKKGNIQFVSMVKELLMCPIRLKMIVDTVADIAKDANRHIMILGVYKDYLHRMMLYFETHHPLLTVALYTGDQSTEERENAKSAQIMIGTYALAEEGLDIPSLNTIVFSTPRKMVDQSSGRIFRTDDPEIPPMIIDIVDTYSVFQFQAYKRYRRYIELGYIDRSNDTEKKEKMDVIKLFKDV